MLNNTARTALIFLISAVWAVNFTAPIFVKGYKPPAEVNVVFMGVVGALVAGYKNGAKK